MACDLQVLIVFVHNCSSEPDMGAAVDGIGGGVESYFGRRRLKILSLVTTTRSKD